MKNYLDIVSKYLTMHKKNTLLAIISVAISVSLVTGIFSMLDVFLEFEKKQIIHDYGNYHLAVFNASDKEMSFIKNRIDVNNAGQWMILEDGNIDGISCKLGALDKSFSSNMNIEVIKGQFPTEENEIMVEQWAVHEIYLDLNIGDTVKIKLDNGSEKKFTLSGIYNDIGSMKAAGVPGVFLSINGANKVKGERTNLFLVEFNKRVNVNEAVDDIKSELSITNDRIELNDRLLAVIGQSEHKAAIGLYTIGIILFCLVLIAGVVMIYNTFNISVMERVRYFGLLRCIGASKSQIKKLVKKEGFLISFCAIPLGIFGGLLITLICSLILKFFNKNIFADIPVFTLSIVGVLAGIIVGFLTVYLATFLPAQKASRVSPLNAVTGNNELKLSKRKKRGFLTKILNVETAMGMNNAFLKKKTLLLMSCSIGISIILFLGFNVFVNFMHSSLKTSKPYTPDISLTSNQGMNSSFHKRISEIKGIKKVYGRMFSYVEITFKETRLTQTYKNIHENIISKDNGLFVPPEKSWLISYDENQFDWAKRDLIKGEISKDKLNANNGVIAVVENLRNNITTKTTQFKIGDKIYISTPSGKEELTVMGILHSVPFNSKELTLAPFITTEKIFSKITDEKKYRAIDIQLKDKKDEETVNIVKGLVNKNITFKDIRQKNADVNQTFLTMAVFIYGFTALIALISILNIINTMNTSIASKTRYLGVMRAVGMSGSQLNKMILAEAATYTINGCFWGILIGIWLQRILILKFLSVFNVIWKFPLIQIILILVLTFIATLISVITPLKRIKSNAISQVVNSI